MELYQFEQWWRRKSRVYRKTGFVALELSFGLEEFY